MDLSSVSCPSLSCATQTQIISPCLGRKCDGGAQGHSLEMAVFLGVVCLSSALALLGLRATGTGAHVSESFHSDCTDKNAGEIDRDYASYDWHFIFNVQLSPATQWFRC